MKRNQAPLTQWRRWEKNRAPWWKSNWMSWSCGLVVVTWFLLWELSAPKVMLLQLGWKWFSHLMIIFFMIFQFFSYNFLSSFRCFSMINLLSGFSAQSFIIWLGGFSIMTWSFETHQLFYWARIFLLVFQFSFLISYH